MQNDSTLPGMASASSKTAKSIWSFFLATSAFISSASQWNQLQQERAEVPAPVPESQSWQGAKVSQSLSLGICLASRSSPRPAVPCTHNMGLILGETPTWLQAPFLWAAVRETKVLEEGYAAHTRSHPLPLWSTVNSWTETHWASPVGS